MEADFIKTTKAAYRLLDFLPEGDPLKNRAKEKVLAVLENVSRAGGISSWALLKNVLQPERRALLCQAAEDISLLVEYFSIAKSQGWVSDINFFIIAKDYQAMKQAFEREATASALVAMVGQVTVPVAAPASDPVPAPEPVAVIPNITPRTQPQKVSSDALNDRQKKIIQFIEKRQRAQVADIVKSLPKVTKRTIRRDLDSLIKLRKIVRRGEFNSIFYTVA